MVVLGEFSLIIASTATGDMKVTLLSIGSFGVVATAIFSSFLLDRQLDLERLARSSLPARTIATMRAFARYFSGIVKDFSPNGLFWRVSQVCWRCIARKLAAIVIILVCMLLARAAVGLAGFTQGSTAASLRGAIAILGGMLIAYYLVLILRDLRPVLDALAHAIARHKKNAKDESIILRNIAIATAFILLALVLPEIGASLQLPALFTLADEFAFLLAFAFIWDVVLHASEIRKRRAGGDGGGAA
jgi:hypothetical protein